MRFQDVEYLFVDDATPDGSIAVIESVLNEYPHRKAQVRLLTHQKNMGVACARNTGLEAATGEYIAFVDADDWIEKDMFEKLYQKAEAGHLDITGCDWYLEFEASRRYMRQPVYEKASDCLIALLTGEMRWFLWAFLVRRDLYVKNNIRFLDGANIGEDMSVLIRCFSFARSYRHVPEALYHYVRSNTASMTALDSKRQIEMVKRNVDVTTGFIHSRYQLGTGTGLSETEREVPPADFGQYRQLRSVERLFSRSQPFHLEKRQTTVPKQTAAMGCLAPPLLDSKRLLSPAVQIRVRNTI